MNTTTLFGVILLFGDEIFFGIYLAWCWYHAAEA